jgi:membrane protein required for colicin V production
MGLTILDFVLLGIMLVSGLLALMRGFTREILSLVAWGLAALAAFFASRQPEAVGFLKTYLDKEILAQIAVAAVAFVLTLIVVSIISVRISDAVVDSAAGAFDRTLGFIYGLLRGLILVAIAYLFYGWLTPIDNQEIWIKNAQSLPIVRGTSNALLNLMPPDVAEVLNAALKGNPPDGATVSAEPATGAAATDQQGDLSNADKQGLNNLSEDAAKPNATTGTGQ